MSARRPRCARSSTTAQLADDPGPAQAALDLVAPLAQGARNDFRGPVLVKAEFGIAVDVAPDRNKFVGTPG
jgi:hypothetical protein